MTDFQVVVGRLLTEPTFAQALADDPAATLAAYSLSEAERTLLTNEVDIAPPADVPEPGAVAPAPDRLETTPESMPRLAPKAAPATESTLPEGYQTSVDVDGDGQWDPHELRPRPDGGVDILVDSTGDGNVDFIGHDDDADGLVDWAEFDTTGDQVFDTQMFDDDGDGWLDRSAPADGAAGFERWLGRP